jgi:putative transposase/transposase-like zinc-binding protein
LITWQRQSESKTALNVFLSDRGFQNLYYSDYVNTQDRQSGLTHEAQAALSALDDVIPFRATELPTERAAANQSIQAEVPKRATELGMADVLYGHWPTFLAQYGGFLEKEHHCTANAIRKCRTAAMGGHLGICSTCGLKHEHFHSCGNRNCDRCGSLKRAQRAAAHQAGLLNTRYCHLVFKLPPEIAEIVLQNKKLLLNVLFDVVAKTLKKVAANARYPKAQIGYLAALHTSGQWLEWHPHLHILIPAGLLGDGEWIDGGPDFMPAHVLTRVFRDLFLEALRKELKKALNQQVAREDAGEKTLQLFGALKPLRDPGVFAEYLAKVEEKKWTVYAKPPAAGSAQTVDYVISGTVPFAKTNIANVANGRVTLELKHKERTNLGEITPMQLLAVECIRRFMTHVPPDGFHKVRACGFLGSRNSRKNLEQCRALLGAAANQEEHDGASSPEIEKMPIYLPGDAMYRCPRCHEGWIVFVGNLPKVIGIHHLETDSS